MAHNAGNFTQQMNRIWCGETKRTMEEDARIVADWHGGKSVRPIEVKDFIHTPGDLPCSLWVFRDGSRVIIADTGDAVIGLTHARNPNDTKVAA